MIALGDANLWPVDSQIVGSPVFLSDVPKILTGDEALAAAYRQRHFGRANIQFSDFHVESAPYESFHSSDPQIAKRWSRENTFQGYHWLN